MAIDSRSWCSRCLVFIILWCSISPVYAEGSKGSILYRIPRHVIFSLQLYLFISDDIIVIL
uniref:Uncharacterized protein n=1 Tax=Arundo donax TaxID=35708 RepID=A0A0A8Z3N6_ARUDO